MFCFIHYTETEKPDDSSECEGKTKTHGGCSANKKGEHFECEVPNVKEIHSISVHNLISKDTGCTFIDGELPEDWTAENGGTYRISENKIIVDYGCRAVFDICYTGTCNSGQLQYNLIITLSLGSIDADRVISETVL